MSSTLKFRCLDEFPSIAKFDEKVDFDMSQKPLYMYFKDEEILEEPEDIKKDSEYYKRKRQRRRKVRLTSSLMIEDSTNRERHGPPKGLQYEGRLVDLNRVEQSTISTNYSHVKTATKKENFKFVLMQFVKKENTVDEKYSIWTTSL